MFEIAISQMMTPRWELAREVDQVARHGFDAISLWRPKLSDMPVEDAAAMVSSGGLRVASVQSAGGFTGGDGRSFDESVADALEAIDMAEALAAPVVVVHSGCRGGHTRSHARRLLGQALELLAPAARRAGVTLAFEPMHPAAAAGCSFVGRLAEAVEFVERCDDPCIGLALDLWHWADDPAIEGLVPRLARLAAMVQVADRVGPPAATADRLPAGHGCLPLERLVADLLAHGCEGVLEFDPVGETVEILGYDGVLAETRIVAASWAAKAVEGVGPLQLRRPAHFRGAGSRRSHASSQTVSPG